MKRVDLTEDDLYDFITETRKENTLAFFYKKIMCVSSHSNFDFTGQFSAGIYCNLGRNYSAFNFVNTNGDTKKAQTFFVMDMFPNQIFPKSKTLRILRRRTDAVSIPNPNAGKQKDVTYGHTSFKRMEPDLIRVSKEIILYARNSWNRKGPIKT